MDEIEQSGENGKYPYQKILLVIIVAVIALAVCLLEAALLSLLISLNYQVLLDNHWLAC